MRTHKATERHRNGHLSVVSDLGRQLVRSRCNEQLTHENLGRAIRTASRSGASIDSLSAASGLKPTAVEEIMQSEDRDADLAILVGIG